MHQTLKTPRKTHKNIMLFEKATKLLDYFQKVTNDKNVKNVDLKTRFKSFFNYIQLLSILNKSDQKYFFNDIYILNIFRYLWPF